MSQSQNTLPAEQIDALGARLAERKLMLLEEIRQELDRSQREFDVSLISQTGDIGNAATASLLRGISEAEAVRDVEEVRDIVLAEQRIAAGRYGICIDCEAPIRFKRLDAYPTAKRCYSCQVEHEESKRRGL